MTPAANARIAQLLCNPFLGSAIRKCLHEAIPSRGCTIATNSPLVDNQTIVSLLLGIYEKSEILLTNRHILSEVDVIDLGASIGVVSSHAARKAGRKSRIISVEANPDLLGLLQRNVHANAPDVTHVIVHGAVSYGVSDEVSFVVAKRNMDSGLTGNRCQGETIVVPRVSLSGLLNTYHVGEFQLLSDIEGAEAHILTLDQESLRRCRLAVVELHETVLEGVAWTVEQLSDKFCELGFSVLEQRGPVFAFGRRPL